MTSTTARLLVEVDMGVFLLLDIFDTIVLFQLSPTYIVSIFSSFGSKQNCCQMTFIIYSFPVYESLPISIELEANEVYVLYLTSIPDLTNRKLN